MRTEAEQRVRRSLALDAFADAEQIESNTEGDNAEAEGSRERRALARLVELATSNGQAKPAKVAEKTTARAKTSDTEETVVEE
jgi:hypothetical protein